MADVYTDQARQALIDAHAAVAAEVQNVVEHFAAADAAMGGILAALDLSDANLPAAASGNPDLFGPYLDAIWQLAPSADYASTFRRMEHVHQTLPQAVVPLYSMPAAIQKAARARLADRQAAVEAAAATARRADAYKLQLKHDAELHQARLLGEDV